MRSTPAETMRKRQRCHDLRAGGSSQRQIQLVLNTSRELVREWLSRPRPTDADIENAAVIAAALSPVEILQRRQQCHDLNAKGATNREIMQRMDVSTSSVRDWLSRPRPSDEEIEAARAAVAAPKTDITGQVGFKSRFDPKLFARLRAEAERQGTATNKIIGCAARLYLDCMDRARAGGGEPVNLLGYR